MTTVEIDIKFDTNVIPGLYTPKTENEIQKMTPALLYRRLAEIRKLTQRTVEDIVNSDAHKETELIRAQLKKLSAGKNPDEIFIETINSETVADLRARLRITKDAKKQELIKNMIEQKQKTLRQIFTTEDELIRNPHLTIAVGVKIMRNGK